MKTALVTLVDGVFFAACVLVIGLWFFGFLPMMMSGETPDQWRYPNHAARSQ